MVDFVVFNSSDHTKAISPIDLKSKQSKVYLNYKITFRSFITAKILSNKNFFTISKILKVTNPIKKYLYNKMTYL